MTLSSGGATRLRGDDLTLAVRIQYGIVRAAGELGPWKTTVTQYAYSLLVPDDGAEMLGWHWHPDRSRTPRPHLHLGEDVLAARGRLTPKAHVPTGRISLEEVLRFTIEDLGVLPLRDDWDEVLRESQQRFERWRTWS